MAFLVGQGVLCSFEFNSGIKPQYKRPYLIVSVTPTEIGLLVISTIKGKEHKLLFKTNKELINYDPPFKLQSFVKLDSLINIPIEAISGLSPLKGGARLDETELNEILAGIC